MEQLAVGQPQLKRLQEMDCEIVNSWNSDIETKLLMELTWAPHISNHLKSLKLSPPRGSGPPATKLLVGGSGHSALAVGKAWERTGIGQVTTCYNHLWHLRMSLHWWPMQHI